MKWFGKNWGAPVQEGDQGVVLPFMAGEGDDRTEAPYHKNCFIRSILGDVV